MDIQGVGNTASLLNTTTSRKAEQQDFKSLMAQFTDTTTATADITPASTSRSAATQPRTAAQEAILRYARADAQDAERLAHDMASGTSAICYDLSESIRTNRTEDIKLASTGEKVGDDYSRAFYLTSSTIDAQRMQIYTDEKAKGTDPVTILNKMIDFTNSQSKDYLAATGWLA